MHILSLILSLVLFHQVLFSREADSLISKECIRRIERAVVYVKIPVNAIDSDVELPYSKLLPLEGKGDRELYFAPCDDVPSSLGWEWRMGCYVNEGGDIAFLGRGFILSEETPLFIYTLGENRKCEAIEVELKGVDPNTQIAVARVKDEGICHARVEVEGGEIGEEVLQVIPVKIDDTNRERFSNNFREVNIIAKTKNPLSLGLHSQNASSGSFDYLIANGDVPLEGGILFSQTGSFIGMAYPIFSKGETITLPVLSCYIPAETVLSSIDSLILE